MDDRTRRVLTWTVLSTIAGSVALLVLCFGCILLANWDPDETLVDLRCSDATLELTLRTTTRGLGVHDRNIIGQYTTRRSTVRFDVDAAVTPHHLPEAHRPRSAWYGPGPEYVHFFLDPAVIDDPTARAIESCAEAHAGTVLAGVAHPNYPMSGTTRSRGRGRIYWRTVADELNVVFRDAQLRRITVRRNGALHYSADNDNERGWVEVEGGGRSIYCCYDFGSLRAEDLSGFVDADGRSPLQYFGADIRPRSRSVRRTP